MTISIKNIIKEEIRQALSNRKIAEGDSFGSLKLRTAFTVPGDPNIWMKVKPNMGKVVQGPAKGKEELFIAEDDVRRA